MSVTFAERVDSEERTQLLQWGISLLAVLAVHIGVAFWLLPKDTPAKPDKPPPAAFLDLPPLPLPGAGGAPGASVQKPAQTKLPANPAPTPPAVPKPVLPPVLPSTPNPQPEPVPVPKIVVPPAAAPQAVLPKPAPPKPPRPQAAQPQPPKPKVPATPTDQTPSLTGSAPIVRLSAVGAWKAGVIERLQKFQVYPPDIRRGQMVTAVDVAFVIDRQGKILSYALAISSGIPSLDAAALEMVRRAQWLPPPPEQLVGDSQRYRFQMTVRFF
jgi:periplasmic protein TonB